MSLKLPQRGGDGANCDNVACTCLRCCSQLSKLCSLEDPPSLWLQVFILLQHSTASMHSYQVPERLLAQARRVWQEAKEAETRGATNDFEKDVLRILSRLNINQVERKVRSTRPVSLTTALLLLSHSSTKCSPLHALEHCMLPGVICVTPLSLLVVFRGNSHAVAGSH